MDSNATWTIERRTEWLTKLERWTERPLTFLALALIPVLVAPYVLGLSSSAKETLDELNYVIWGVFASDLLAKLVIAPNRRHYLRTHWFDVILVVVPMLRPLRAGQSVRLLRLVRAGLVIASLARVLVVGRSLLVRHGFHYVLIAAMIVIVGGGALAVVFERDAPDATIRTLPDGLWWAMTTATTVGYGDIYPKTAAGRGVAVVLMLLGISLFGALTANLAAFFVEGQENEVVAELRALRQQVEDLSRQINAKSDDQ
jgi:voltage-gated potassium channel